MADTAVVPVMVERVGRAMYAQTTTSKTLPWESLDDNGVIKPAILRDAQAAIEAMREPLDAMYEAASRAPNPEYGSLAMPHKNYRAIWHAMIDEALRG